MSIIALLTCLVLVAFLFARDSGVRPMPSPALWIPFAWFVILGTRPLSAWFGDRELDSADAFLEGSPLDRYTLVALILLGLIVVLRRKPEWYRVLGTNIWFAAFIGYCAISIVWSDFPFVSFKRWVRELGNVVMVLLILAEEDPGRATRALLARFSYLVIPLSVVLIRFFPAIGTYFSSDIASMAYCGITLHKNMLGSIMLICGVYLLWELLYLPGGKEGREGDMPLMTLLLMLTGYLMVVSSSSTSLLCVILGVGILLAMKLSCLRKQSRHLGIYTIIAALVVLGLFSAHGMLEAITAAVGRDLTFTGRTELWSDVLEVRINPLLGTGYQSFWLGTRADDLWERYIFQPRQSHNGYLETYLNGGLLGLFLLLGVMLSIGTRLKEELEAGNSFAILLFTFWITALFYNFTESRFVGPNPIWIMLSLAALYQPSRYHSPDPAGRQPALERKG